MDFHVNDIVKVVSDSSGHGLEIGKTAHVFMLVSWNDSACILWGEGVTHRVVVPKCDLELIERGNQVEYKYDAGESVIVNQNLSRHTLAKGSIVTIQRRYLISPAYAKYVCVDCYGEARVMFEEEIERIPEEQVEYETEFLEFLHNLQ